VGAIALLAAAATIAYHSVYEILTPHHLPHWSTLAVLAGVIAIKMALARWIGFIGDEAGSTALASDAWHHWSDAFTSLAAFIGISIGLIGGRVRAALRTSPLRIADALVHIEPDS